MVKTELRIPLMLQVELQEVKRRVQAVELQKALEPEKTE